MKSGLLKLLQLILMSSCFYGGVCQCPSNVNMNASIIDEVRVLGSSFRGRAEVKTNGRWGVMCDNGYTDNEAMAICRQLQCEGGRKDDSSSVYLTANSTNSHSFICDGSELSLNECTYTPRRQCSGCDYRDIDTVCTPATGEPLNVRISTASQTSFTLKWEPPATANCQLVDGYRLLCREQRGMAVVHSKNYSAGIRTTLISGLVPHTPYVCCVTAFNGRGGRERTQCSSIHTTPATFPTAPQEVAVSSILATEVSVSWLWPQFVNGSGITNYTAQCNHSQGIYQTASETVGSESQATNVPGLHPYTNYTCCVSAANLVGRGPSQCSDEFQTAEAAPTAPPQNILVNPSSNSVSISWAPPPSAHQNGRITDYTVQLYEKGKKLVEVKSNGGYNVTITKIKSYTQYEARLAATTSAGTGVYATVIFKTKINATEAGVYALLVFSVVGLLVPSILTCIIVVSCYKVDSPCNCCCSKKGSNDDEAVPGALQYVSLPKKLRGSASLSSSTSEWGNRGNEEGGFEARVTLEIDDEMNDTSTMLLDRSGKNQEMETLVPDMLKILSEKTESDQDVQEKGIIYPGGTKSLPVMGNTEVENSDDFQPTSEDQLSAQKIEEEVEACIDDSSHNAEFQSDISFRDSQDSQAKSKDSTLVNQCLDVQVRSLISVNSAPSESVAVKHKDTANPEKLALSARNKGNGFHSAISYI